MMQADLLGFLPRSLLCMMLVLWFSFRSWRAVLLPLVSIALGVGALLGLMGWIGASITLATLVLPSLLLVIGGSYSVHVSSAVINRARRRDPEAVADGVAEVDAVLERVALPVTVSAITTAVGFGSLAFHPIPAISGLGVFAVLGIALMATGCLLGLPLAFAIFPDRRSVDGTVSDASAAHDRFVDRAAVAAADFGVRNRRAVFFAGIVVVVVAVAGASRVEVDTDFLSAFRADSDVRIANRAISESLAGTSPISVVIEGPEEGYFRSIAPLRRVKDFQDFVEGSEGVDSTISFVDYLEELDLGLQAAGGDMVVTDSGDLVEKPPPPSFWNAPESQLPEIFQLVALSPQTFSGVVTPDFKRLRVTLRTAATGSGATKALLEEIDNYASAMFPLGVKVRTTGNLVVVSEVSDRVLSGQIESLALAFGAIFVILALLFLSLRVGLAAMIPNVLPVLVFFGVMGWAGVPLNLATSIIAAVALGIAVDDTIHYMAHLNRVVKSAKTQRDALLLTMRDIGRPVVATSLTLTAGFLVMVFSDFVIISQFGWLSAMTMIVALGRLKEFSAGEQVMVRGEPGHEMYLVLTGSAEVVGADGKTVLAGLERGDVVGEMALLRSSVRTADVVAREAVEVLVIDEDFLRRLRARYPRFAARFFVNIARILSDRLENANRRLGLVG
jgi:predicted RND superfamily exporter protein